MDIELYLDNLISNGLERNHWFMTKQTMSDYYFPYYVGYVVDTYPHKHREDQNFARYYMECFEKNGIDPLFYTSRERQEDEVFPWDFIDIGVSKKFLWLEYQRAKQETVTPNCRQKCAGCGAKIFGGGVF